MYGAEAVATRLRVGLLTIEGTWPDDASWGLPIPRWARNPATPDTEIEALVRLLARQVDGVRQVVSVDVARQVEGLRLSCAVRVDPTISAADLLRVGACDDPRAVGAWYTLLVAPRNR